MVSGVSVAKVKFILKIFSAPGQARRRGYGQYLWNKGYAITEKTHKKLGLPEFLPLSVDHANGGPESLDGIDIRYFKLPEPEWRPEKDTYSRWTVEPL